VVLAPDRLEREVVEDFEVGKNAHGRREGLNRREQRERRKAKV
jgi:hypothetical protein